MLYKKRILLFVLCACLTVGGVIHIIDNLIYGFLPYRFAPLWMNIYWTALGFFDLFAVYLLLKKLRYGLILGLLIMISNVAINSYAFYELEVFDEPVALQLQSLFLGFTIAASVALWESFSPGSEEKENEKERS